MYKHVDDANWVELGMTLIINDRYEADFTVEKEGEHVYTIEGWRCV